MRRVVLKVGSHVLSENGNLARKRISNLCGFLAKLSKKYEVILVSSGAVAAGYEKLKIDKDLLPNRQALSALGQPYLMSVYQKKLALHDINVAQLLLNGDDFDSLKRTFHAKEAIEVLLKNKVLPIINENDTTAIEELVFGDNDQLSAHVAHYFDAHMLIILSDIDGYYDANPKTHKDAKMYKVLNAIDEKSLQISCDPTHTFATGGIVTKLKAAKFLLQNKKQMFMASGFDLSDAESFLLQNKHIKGTLFKCE